MQPSSPVWSAQQYTAFEDERTRPARDLVAAIPLVDVRRAVDLGCGPGNSTEILAARCPEAEVHGVDTSADMIEAARQRMPGTRFDLADIATWAASAPYGIILANAVLQWLPGHETLLPKLVNMLEAGGSLAVQMPDNLDEPAHRLMREVAADGPWAEALREAANQRASLGSAAWYYALLGPLCRRVEVWRTTYHHPLAGPAAVVEWFKGSGLRPFFAPLDAPQRAAYLAAYEAKLARAYETQPDGTVLLPFPRLFIVATR